MAFNLDVAGDWTIFDWLQSITYYSRVNETDYAVGLSCQALKRENIKTYDLGGETIELPEHHAIWEVWLETIAQPKFIAKRGDKFVAQSVVAGMQTWIVESADYCDKTTRYRLHCMPENDGA